MLTSDPYAILTLGEQKSQMMIKKSDLNPVWNEVLKPSVPRNYGPLKLVIFFVAKHTHRGEASYGAHWGMHPCSNTVTGRMTYHAHKKFEDITLILPAMQKQGYQD